MIKQIKNYTFDASLGKITFTDEASIELENIKPIINVTRGKTLFNGVNSDLGGSVSTNILTLELDTSAMDDSDDLSVYYDDGTEPATEGKQDDAIEQVSPATNLEGGGKISVGTTAVEITFTLTPKTIILTADQSNNDIIYWGKSNVNSSGNNAMGYLEANNVQEIHFDDTTNAIYVVAKSGTQNIWKGVLS